MTYLAILFYIAALCCANLLAHHFGPSATPWIALTLIGLDLSIRDWLNVTLPRWGMAILIPACLGNGDRFGNSAGNVIAIRALGLDPAEVHNQKP